MYYLKYLLAFLLIFSIHEASYTQVLERKMEKEKKKIQDFFLKDLPWKTTEDSTMIIGFSFKIRVDENAKGISRAISIVASDSIAYKLFPKYEVLKKIDYYPFMKGRKEVDFIIPVLIEMVGSQPLEYYDRKKLINFLSNIGFAKVYFKVPLSMFHFNKESKKKETENYTYFEPVIIWMDKRLKHKTM
jgi:hypothetical protein